jgi:sugar lactone lactonase YvrE
MQTWPRLASIALLAALGGCKPTASGAGAVGSSPSPATTRASAAPTRFEALAVDADGNVYTTHGDDGSGVVFTKWDAAGGWVFAVASPVEGGRTVAAGGAIAVDADFVYCAVAAPAVEPWNARQQVRRFARTDGRASPFAGKPLEASDATATRPGRTFSGPAGTLVDGHIQLYEWPGLGVPAKATPDDARVMAAPIRALDVVGATLYVADALAGKVRMFDTTTGGARGDFAAHLPTAVAVDPTGQIWVAHDHGTVRAYRSDGYAGVTFGGPPETASLTFGPGAALYACDSRAGRVLTLDAAAEPAGFVALPGFADVRAVAADGAGNLFTVTRGTGDAARLTKWTGQGGTAKGPRFAPAWSRRPDGSGVNGLSAAP